MTLIEKLESASATYGFSRTYWDGTSYAVSGYSSPLEARIAVFTMMIRDGYTEGPLREYWWQVWRPRKYSEGYSEAALNARQAQ